MLVSLSEPGGGGGGGAQLVVLRVMSVLWAAHLCI